MEYEISHALPPTGLKCTDYLCCEDSAQAFAQSDLKHIMDADVLT